jgi:hypothetical protein
LVLKGRFQARRKAHAFRAALAAEVRTPRSGQQDRRASEKNSLASVQALMHAMDIQGSGVQALAFVLWSLPKEVKPFHK